MDSMTVPVSFMTVPVSMFVVVMSSMTVTVSSVIVSSVTVTMTVSSVTVTMIQATIEERVTVTVIWDGEQKVRRTGGSKAMQHKAYTFPLLLTAWF